MVFNTLTKIILTPIYYIIHHNYLFGFIHKFFVKNFYYKNMKFELKINDIPFKIIQVFYSKHMNITIENLLKEILLPKTNR